MQRITVRPQGRGAVLSGHPWIMANSLVLPARLPNVGDVVELADSDGRSFGQGLFNASSRIAVRRYGNGPDEDLNTDFFVERLNRALEFRDVSPLSHRSPNLRLVFSEGDQLSGLIVDRYGDYAVVQQTAAALQPLLPSLLDVFQARYQLRGILHFVDTSTSKLEGIESRRDWIIGKAPTSPLAIEDHGLIWEVDLNIGQKTGYYHDQRENRIAAAAWLPCTGSILDVCCYLGGFAITIARARPDCQVIGIDTSQKAIDAARKHAEMNRLSNVRFEVGDFLESLEKFAADGNQFEGIVLDPPKLAGSRDSIDRALRAYHRLNSLAVGLLKPGGILVTCSCSGRVSREDFWNMLAGVSKKTRRAIQILEQRGAAADHPVIATCPETDYLKCFICRVL